MAKYKIVKCISSYHPNIADSINKLSENKKILYLDELRLNEAEPSDWNDEYTPYRIMLFGYNLRLQLVERLENRDLWLTDIALHIDFHLTPY